MSGWLKTHYPDVRYREHPTRKHNAKQDRTFYIRYRKNGKRCEESTGIWSMGMNARKSAALRDEIISNIKLGRRPQSIKEMWLMYAENRVAEKLQQELAEKENITFGAVAEKYLDWLRTNKKSPHGNESRYRNHIRPLFSGTPLRDITVLHLERFKKDLKEKGLAPKTVHHCLTMIRTVYKKAVVWGYYNGPVPTSQIEFPQINNSRLRFLSHEEAALLLETLENKSQQTHDQALIALHCGLRTGEIKDMRWGHLDFKQGVIHLLDSKAGESQQAFMTNEVKEMLLDRLPVNPKPSDYVFPGIDGGKQYKISDTFKRTVAALGFNAGLDPKDRQQRVVFHTLRHTFCSWLAIQGTPLYTIKELARHKSISQTERYSHLCPDQKQDAEKQIVRFFKKTITRTAEIVDLAVARNG